ncbi:hypothetical protein H0A36_24960 [Endozoicomonas sp. SM1973]|uniref:Uncharacterized protein n=1 Tax=Spartinivicinus marinus TaxID=2994442 RepID=A0A853IGX6_9GAMM|nr:hypothetical protein [Spartinivicinus marinus]MCX4030321.1 hypothetical protein [Spartinivicinus marinus]NYZ69274.1 hypothetical protein [Spartinivicinus marinus]
MKRTLFYFLLVSMSNYTAADTLSDQQIKSQIIQQSIQSYPGNCPCPYNRASNGSRCGKRSAWSRAGGYSPYCYPSDVSNEMVKQYKAKQTSSTNNKY